MTDQDRNLLKHFNRSVDWLKQEKLKEKGQTKVKVSQLKKVTIWKSNNDIRNAVRSGLVTRIKEEGSIYYILESIPTEFKKTAI